jgi:predicted nucleotidyltransferase
MERQLEQLTKKLRDAYGARLISVVLYGSAAAGDHDGRFSDLNILCVLDRITPEELRASGDIFRWWRKAGNPSPLLLSAEEVKTSTDCFAIEFRDILASRRVLFGEDICASIEVDHCFYRAQVERELRAKLLRLRQKAAGMISDATALRQLLADSISTFCVLFRHALILSGAEAGQKKRETIELARAAFGIDTAPFDALLDFREGRTRAGDLEPVALLAAYMSGITVVIEAVDRLEK